MAKLAKQNQADVQSIKWIKPLSFVTLWMFTLVTAIGVVFSSFQSRKATDELEYLRREASSLEVISGQYLLEKSSWAAYSRVEKMAHSTLNMNVPSPDKTVLVYRQ